jgi:hypothetical protein
VVWLGALSALGAALAPLPADAQRSVRPEEVRRLLDEAAPRDVLEGLESAGLSGSPRMVPLVGARIRRGLTPELLDVAIDTLAVLGRPEAGPVLFELARHRRAEIRRRAIEAIVACEPPDAEPVLIRALADADATVRTSAALALGALGRDSSIEPLFAAFDRGVLDAITAIGQRARPSDLARLTGYLGRQPLVLLAPALTEVLARSDVPERDKLTLVATLEALATPEVGRFLDDVQAGLPEDRAYDTLRAAAAAASERIVR